MRRGGREPTSTSRALATARAALAGQTQVRVDRLEVPREWPAGEFDLVVVSELGYYLEAGALAVLLDRIVGSLARGAGPCWRATGGTRSSTTRRPGTRCTTRCWRRPELMSAVRHVEEDFRLDLLTLGPAASPARREGLVR